MGEGWGVSEYDCEICPTRGTLDFDEPCLESGFGSKGEDIDECKHTYNELNTNEILSDDCDRHIVL